MSMNRLIPLILLTLVAGCALAPPTEVARLESDKSMHETAQLLQQQAEQCWKRSAKIFQDGIKIDARMSIYDTAIVSAARWAADIGIQEPFLTLEVLGNEDDSSTVVISEGDYACDLSGSCSSLDLHADVVRWLRGDLSCGE